MLRERDNGDRQVIAHHEAGHAAVAGAITPGGRLANEMGKNGLLRFGFNPHHERAKLVLMTDQGRPRSFPPWPRSAVRLKGWRRDCPFNL
jgi:hypothetical protein